MQEESKTPQEKYPKVGIPTRLVFTGDMKVGKTSIINSYFSIYTNTERTREITPYTVPSKHINRILHDSNLKPPGAPFTVQLIDSGGDTRLRAIYEHSIYKQANAFMLVCSVNDRASFQNLDEWYRVLNIPKGVPLFLIGNKIDLEKADWAVQDYMIREKFEEFGHVGDVFMTSALQGQSNIESVQRAVDAAIVKTIEQMIKQIKNPKRNMLRDSYMSGSSKTRSKCC